MCHLQGERLKSQEIPRLGRREPRTLAGLRATVEGSRRPCSSGEAHPLLRGDPGDEVQAPRPRRISPRPIFTHLIADTRRRSLAGSLKGGTKSKISSFWNRLSKDVQGIARRTAFDPALEPGVRKVAGYLEPTLDEIIDALNESLDTIPKSQAPARKELGGYLARLRAARQKLSLKAVLDELDSPGRSRCLVAPTSEAPRARSGDRVGRTSRLVPARRIGGVRRGAPRRRP